MKIMLTPTIFILLLLSLAPLPAESKKWKKRIASLEGKVVTVKAELEEHNSGLKHQHDDEILSLQRNITAKDNEVETLEPTLALATQDQVAQELAAQRETVNGQDEDISGLNRTVASQDEALAELKDTMTTQEGNLTTLKDIVRFQSENLAEMEETVTTQDANLAGLNEIVTAVKAVMTTQDGDLAGLKETMSTLVSKVAALEQANTDQGSKIVSLEQTRTTLSSQISTQSSKIAAQSSKIAVMERTDTAQNGRIATLESTKATLNSKITALETAKTSLTSKINTLETAKSSQRSKITALERKATKIVQGPTGSLRSTACLVTCVGNTGKGNTTWSGSSNSGYVKTYVSISGCGFVSGSIPIISATVEGGGYTHDMLMSVQYASNTQFRVWMEGWVHTSRSPTGIPATKPGTSIATSDQWNVHWYATGYVC